MSGTIDHQRVHTYRNGEMVMSGFSPLEERLSYIVSFDMPTGRCPITRMGELTICPDGQGRLTVLDQRGLLAPRELCLSAADVCVIRAVLQFWLTAPTPERWAMMAAD